MNDLQEFERYMAHLSEGLGHADRHAGLRVYCTGLISPLAEKSVEPMAAHLAPSATRSRHQSLHHFVADLAWSDEQMLLRVARWVVPAMDFSDGGWWIVDDTGFPKQGQHSVGVARQYCGMLGKQDNCQVAVSVTLACQMGSLAAVSAPGMGRGPGASREGWRSARLGIRHQAGDCVGADRSADGAACDRAPPAGRSRLWRGHGVSRTPQRVGAALRGGRDRPGDGAAPLPPSAYSGGGNVPTRQRMGDAKRQRPLSVKELAFELDPSQWHTLEWREGTNFTLRSRFARVRVHAAHRDHQRSQLRPQEWLLIEWPEGHREPMKYWLST